MFVCRVTDECNPIYTWHVQWVTQDIAEISLSVSLSLLQLLAVKGELSASYQISFMLTLQLLFFCSKPSHSVTDEFQRHCEFLHLASYSGSAHQERGYEAFLHCTLYTNFPQLEMHLKSQTTNCKMSTCSWAFKWYKTELHIAWVTGVNRTEGFTSNNGQTQSQPIGHSFITDEADLHQVVSWSHSQMWLL